MRIIINVSDIVFCMISLLLLLFQIIIFSFQNNAVVAAFSSRTTGSLIIRFDYRHCGINYNHNKYNNNHGGRRQGLVIPLLLQGGGEGRGRRFIDIIKRSATIRIPTTATAVAAAQDDEQQLISTDNKRSSKKKKKAFPKEEKKEPSSKKSSSQKQPATKRRNWDESYELLVEYHKERGDSNVPQTYKKDPNLGVWVRDQRRIRNRLSVDKISKLDALDFIWDGKVAKKLWGDKKWEEMFQLLDQYKKENGHCNVSKYDKENKELGSWVQLQRLCYTNSVPSLTPYRIQKLESIGFVWRLRAFSECQSNIWEEQWDEKFDELVMYKKEHGHCNVPRFYEPNQPLADWVSRQRSMNAGTHVGGAVRSDRKKRLDEIGFDWDFDKIYDKAWLSMYNQLKELQKSYEENNLERQTWASAVDQPELWNWELNQQNFYKRGRLDPQREAMMEEIGYWKSIGLKRETTQISE